MTTRSQAGSCGRAHVAADEARRRLQVADRLPRRAPRPAASARCRCMRPPPACRPRRGPCARRACMAAIADSRLANRPWPQPMSTTRRAGARRSGRVRSGRGTPGRAPACRARNARRSCPPSCRARSRASVQLGASAASGRRHLRAHAANASGRVTARRPSARMRASSGGSTSSTTALPCGRARGMAVVQQQDVAGLRVRRVSRASTVPASRSRVSKPRRVQLTSDRPRRCSTGSRNGLRKPGRCAEARRALAGDLAAASAARARSRPRSRAGRETKSCGDAAPCGSGRCGRAPRSRAPAPDARHALGDAEEGGALAVRIEQVEHLRRDLGVGAVVDGDRDLARAPPPPAGSRVMLGPSRLLRGSRPAAVISTWLSTTAPRAHGAAPGTNTRRAAGEHVPADAGAHQSAARARTCRNGGGRCA